MKQFLALLKLELSQWKAAFSRSGASAQKKGRKIPRALVVVLLLGVFAAYLILFELRAIDVFMALGAPKLLPKMLVGVGMLLTLFLGLVQVISNLYFSRDIVILGYVPVRSEKIYTARLCGQWLEEIAISALIILPGTVIYFTRTGFDALFLLRALLITCISPVMPLCLGALMAGVLTLIPGFWRHREIISTVFTIVLFLAYMAFCYGAGQLGGSAADDSEEFRTMLTALSGRLDGLITSLPPVRWCANGLTEGGMPLVWALLGSFATAAAAYALFARNYVRTASRALETSGTGKKVDLGRVRLRAASPLIALTRREIREMIRTPAYLINGLLISLIMPTFMVGMMIFSINGAVDGGFASLLVKINATGSMNVVVAAALTALMGMMLGMNSAAASAVSREGKRHPIFRSLPVNTRTIILSKLLMALFFHCIGLIPACVLTAVMIPGFGLYPLLMFFWGILLAWIGTCTSLALDVGKPKMEWINEVQAIKSGANQLISLVIYLVVLGLLGLGTYFLVTRNLFSLSSYALVLTAALAVIGALAGLWLRHNIPAYEEIGE